MQQQKQKEDADVASAAGGTAAAAAAATTTTTKRQNTQNTQTHAIGAGYFYAFCLFDFHLKSARLNDSSGLEQWASDVKM